MSIRPDLRPVKFNLLSLGHGGGDTTVAQGTVGSRRHISIHYDRMVQ